MTNTRECCICGQRGAVFVCLHKGDSLYGVCYICHITRVGRYDYGPLPDRWEEARELLRYRESDCTRVVVSSSDDLQNLKVIAFDPEADALSYDNGRSALCEHQSNVTYFAEAKGIFIVADNGCCLLGATTKRNVK